MAFEIPESALPREPESIERLMWRVDPEWQDLERERRAAAREAASYR